jgi:hypothetical protein
LALGLIGGFVDSAVCRVAAQKLAFACLICPLVNAVPKVFILNGASYDQRFLDATRTSSLSRADSSNPDSVAALNKDLDDCALLANNKGKPLLASLAGGKTTDDGKLLIQAVVSGAQGSKLLLCRPAKCCKGFV